MRRQLLSVCVLGAFIQSIVWAQETVPEPLLISLDNSAWIEINKDDETHVTVVTSQVNSRTVNQAQTVQRTKTEQRTRTIIENGTPKVVTYTVTIPYVEIVKNARPVGSPGEPRFTTLPIQNVSVWNADGKALTADELKQRLSKPAAAIVVTKTWPKRGGIDPLQLAVLRDDILFIYVADPPASAKDFAPAEE